MSLLFLGSGASTGSPMLCCSCKVCRGRDPKNQRLRPSALLKVGGKNFLFDAGPDFRAQALRFEIDRVDGLFLTHTHFDHVYGLDDLRPFYMLHHKVIPCLLSQESLAVIHLKFPHLFEPSCRFDFRVLPGKFGRIAFEGLEVHYLNFVQSGMEVTGFRLGKFAYVLDIREYTEEVFVALKGVECLVLGALRHVPAPGHFSFEEAVAFAGRVGAKEVYFSHLGHDVDYHATPLPPHVQLAFDGLEIACPL